VRLIFFSRYSAQKFGAGYEVPRINSGGQSPLPLASSLAFRQARGLLPRFGASFESMRLNSQPKPQWYPPHFQRGVVQW
jgi:hypothetical protein